MKLTIEVIKDQTGKDVMKYSYEIGSSVHNSTMPLCAEGLVTFTNLLSKCIEYGNWEMEKDRKRMLKQIAVEEYRNETKKEEK
jgi:hypothetical protein